MVPEVEIIRNEPLSDGFLRLNRYRLGLTVPSTGRRVVVDRECVGGLNSAAVLPFNPATGRVVLVEQFRIGALQADPAGLTCEPPGGVIATGADAAETARREALEEAGCRIGAMTRIGTCRTCPGFSDERVELFCGEWRQAALPAVAGDPGEGEFTRVIVMDIDALIPVLGQGRFTAATLIIAVQWLALHRHRLDALWSPDAPVRV
jgi:ADP-ribose pyrophosphatase